MRKLARILRGGEAAEIAEVAMVLPLVFMFLLGIVWFGRAFNIYATITQAAQQGAVTAARAECATCPAGAGWNGTSFPSDTTVENTVFSVMRASSLDPSQVTASPVTLNSCPSPWPDGGCTTSGSNLRICRSVQVNFTSVANPQPTQCGTVVSFQYPFQFFLPFTSLGSRPILLTATAQSRMEN